MHNKQERKRKEQDIKKKKKKKKNKEGFEVTMSVEIITFKKLGFFSRLLGLFFFFSSTPLDEPCSNLSLENPNLKNRSQNSPYRRQEKQRLARGKH